MPIYDSYLLTHRSHWAHSAWRSLWTLQQEIKKEISHPPSPWERTFDNIQALWCKLRGKATKDVANFMSKPDIVHCRSCTFVYRNYCILNYTYISSTRTLRTSGTRGTRGALQKRIIVLLKCIKLLYHIRWQETDASLTMGPTSPFSPFSPGGPGSP